METGKSAHGRESCVFDRRECFSGYDLLKESANMVKTEESPGNLPKLSYTFTQICLLLKQHAPKRCFISSEYYIAEKDILQWCGTKRLLCGSKRLK